MIHIPRWQTILIVCLCILGIIYASPNILSPQSVNTINRVLPGVMQLQKVNLGLDLQGGSHLLLKVDLETVRSGQLEDLEQSIRTELRTQRIGYKGLSSSEAGVKLTLRNAEDLAKLQAFLRKLDPGLKVSPDTTGGLVVDYDQIALKQARDQALGQSIEIVRRRIDASGTKEPIIQRQGEDRIIVQLPGVDDPESIKTMLGRTARLSFHGVATDGSVGAMTLPVQDRPGETLPLERRPLLTGDMLVTAAPATDPQTGQPIVTFKLNNTGSRAFCEATTRLVGQPFAIVLDNEIISAPRINTPICGGSATIEGGFSFQEVSDLSLLLRAGALPAPLVVMEERSVGPSLGRDSVEAGLVATEVAMVAVVVIMIACYGLLGLFAAAALLLNVVLLMAILSVFQMTLTLPGIAGIILTIGTAVDANVLIFSRIRDELHSGRSLVSAIDAGYRQAMSSITDANMTTLIAAGFLFMFGAGPVKGFAVTLIVGTLTSVFSAIMVTRLMIVEWLRRFRPTSLKL